MIASLGNLLKGVIDYAGLFPPADLEMNRAVEIFTADRQGAYYKWLQHFIVPAERISELDSLRTASTIDPHWTLSVLVGGGETLRDWHAAVESGLAAVDSSRHRPAPDTITVLEIALPTAMAADTASFVQAIDEIEARIRNTLLADCDLFFETTTSASHRRALAEVLCDRQTRTSRVGLKLRTGGRTPSHIPSLSQLSENIQLCHSLQIPWKATAGLHHPLPHDCPQIGATMHGFLNLLFAVVLLEAKVLPVDRLENLLADRNAEHFTFTESCLAWEGIAADLSQIQAGRERFISFGSCSFAEPVKDLAQLGLLPKQSDMHDS